MPRAGRHTMIPKAVVKLNEQVLSNFSVADIEADEGDTGDVGVTPQEQEYGVTQPKSLPKTQ